MKRIEKDGKFYRMRRGKLVEIPPGWVGHTTTDRTLRDRKKEAVIAHDAKHRGRNNRLNDALHRGEDAASEGMNKPRNPLDWYWKGGGRRDKEKQCAACEGKGVVYENKNLVVPYIWFDSRICPTCGGTKTNTIGERS